LVNVASSGATRFSKPRPPLTHTKIRFNEWVELLIKRLYFVEVFSPPLDCFPTFLALQLAIRLVSFMEVSQRAI
jgi:hypothetical protein